MGNSGLSHLRNSQSRTTNTQISIFSLGWLVFQVEIGYNTLMYSNKLRF